MLDRVPGCTELAHLKRKPAVKDITDPRFAGHSWQWYVLTDEKEALFRKMFLSGADVRAIAKELGLTRDQFTYFRLKFGLNNRNVKYRVGSISKKQEELIKVDYFKRKSIKYIAKKFKTNPHTISKLVQSRKWSRKEYNAGEMVGLRVFLRKEEYVLLQRDAFKFGVSATQYLRIHFNNTREAIWSCPDDTEMSLPLFSDHPVIRKSKSTSCKSTAQI